MTDTDTRTVQSNIIQEQGSNGYIFLGLIWLAFLLPSKYWGAFNFIIGHTNLSEMAIIAMPFVYALYPRNDAIVSETKYLRMRKAIFIFFGLILLVNIMQFLIYSGAIKDYILANRSLVPLFVSLALIYMGPRIKSRLLILNIGLCLSLSFAISLLYVFFNLEFTPIFSTELDEEAFEIFAAGRVGNINADYSYLSVYILVLASVYWKYIKKNVLFIVLMASCILGIFVNYMTFNRTFMIISPLMIAFFAYRYFNLRTIMTVIIMVCSSFIFIYYIYTINDIIRYQVDNRIIYTAQSKERFLTSAYYDNRDVLYMSYLEAGEKYFPLGVPPTATVTERYHRGRFLSYNTTDISLLNVFLRFGIITAILFILIGTLFYKYIASKKLENSPVINKIIQLSLLYSLPFMALASFNIDLFVGHYSVLFISILFVSIQKSPQL